MPRRLEHETSSTKEQDDNDADERRSSPKPSPSLSKKTAKTKFTESEISKMYFDARNSDVRFATTCMACGRTGETRMSITSVPNFSEIILMCFVCEKCGFKDAEVKPGGDISEKGTITTLHVTLETAASDLKRDVLKSGDASLAIPELGFESAYGTLGAVYTTVEGLLVQTKENMESSSLFQMGLGDSASAQTKSKFRAFLDKLGDVIEGRSPFTLIIKDPIGSSWIYSPLAPQSDPQIDFEYFDRSEEENEILGLNQLDTSECDEAERRALNNGTS